MSPKDGARRVVVVVFDGVQSLDVTGPVEVFSIANRFLAGQTSTDDRRYDGRQLYDLRLAAAGTGPVRTSSGLSLGVDCRLSSIRGPLDTLVVAGGDGADAAAADAAIVSAVDRLARRCRRVTSVCTGAFVLAATGRLDGRRATTHWGSCARLAAAHPAVTVDPDPIFVRDGDVVTSAGVTAGIDLCLALVQEDHGRRVALQVARQMVVFLKRPGGQSQFSAHLRADVAERDAIADVQRYAVGHLAADLRVERLAERATMSPRHFARTFLAEVGVTPARFVERGRVEAARRLLEESSASVDDIARRCGFGTAETLRRSFLRLLDVSPSDYRRRFRNVSISPFTPIGTRRPA
ncbi:MAG: GlxA family transcriptional regulator [Actinomycetota bacterium]|nr:GlxA family transcriptional regulator [Actinomycetota bacterium]